VLVLAWIGVEGKIGSDRLRKLLERLSYRPVKELKISVKTSKGWMEFNVFEVIGFVEGAARVVSGELKAAGLEAGDHLILGEVSARLWEEAVKVVFPDGSEEVIPILTYDGFLDIRIPNENVRGVKATIVIAGKVYELPLSLKDLEEIYSKGKEWAEKVEKAAMAYGVRKVLSQEAIEALLKGTRIGRKIEVDHESGYVIISERGRITTKPVSTYILELLAEGSLDEAKKIYKELPEEMRNDVRSIVEEERDIQRSLGRDDLANTYEEFLKKIKENPSS